MNGNKTPVNLVTTVSSNRDGEVIVKFLRGLINKVRKTGDENALHILKGLQSVMIANDLWSSYLNSINTFRYLDLDSTYRNRTLYPNSSNFVVPYTNSAPGNNIITAVDPVCDSLPYTYDFTVNGCTTTLITTYLNPLIVNYYKGYLQIGSEIRTIVRYIPNTGIFITPPLATAPGFGLYIYIRNTLPVIYGTTGIPASETIIPLTFNTAPSTKDDFYKNMVIRFGGSTSGALNGVTRVITSYNASTHTITINPPLDLIPFKILFDINQFSTDNAIPLRYNGSKTLDNEQCYTIQLCQLSIPNIALKYGIGPLNGSVFNYPYIYVHIYNDPSASESTIYSNNPNSALAVFKVAINQVNSNLSSYGIPFIVFDNVNLAMPTSIKFAPWKNIRMRVTLPNGNDISFLTDDNIPPYPPNPLLQISSLFALNLGSTPPTTDNIL